MYWDIEGLACVFGHRRFGVCIGTLRVWRVYWDIEGLVCVLGHREFGVCIGT